MILPFGNTDVKRDTIAGQIDRDQVILQLERGDVENAQARLDSFLSVLPRLFDWLETYGRDFPWRYTDDPWRVYISEILLQRTRGAAVEDIYNGFFERYPTPEALNKASKDDVKTLINPLGFGNQRTRTLKEVAELLVSDHNGSIPESVEELKKPWRVGDYSARATLLFAFHNPEPLVDANIARIIGRYFDYQMPKQPHKDTDVYALMEALTTSDPEIARAFYLSLIDLGAIICTSKSPQCPDCPIRKSCQYRISGIDIG